MTRSTTATRRGTNTGERQVGTPQSRAADRARRVAALQEQIVTATAALVDAGAWQRMLAVAARFHTYSLGNQLLIAVQNPDATRVAGFEAWKAGEGALDHKPPNAATRWVTRERPKIDRIACPWLISRFVDADADFLYVPTKQVPSAAQERDAVPYDIADVHFSHEGELCSFDAFLKHYRLHDPALAALATIVRGADTARLDLAAQAPGLAAISLGLSRNFADDHEMLAHGMVMYDALYTWCKEGKDEAHTWNPQAYR